MGLEWLFNIFGESDAKKLAKFSPLLEKINSLESGVSQLSDQELSSKTVEFRERLANGEMLDNILPEA